MQKGTIIFVNGIWYIVIYYLDGKFYCICDNANNRYCFGLNEIEHLLDPKTAIYLNAYGLSSIVDDDEKLFNAILSRPIPVEEIAEAMVGLNDDRFDDWIKKENKV